MGTALRQATLRTVMALLLAVALLFPGPLLAAGKTVSQVKLRQQIKQILDREGYVGRYRNGQGLQRGISAYLWDHRHWLKKTNFHNSRQQEALLCLLISRGYPGFEQYAGKPSFMKNCRQLVN